VTKYKKRISGPLLDRIGIYIEVPRADYDKLNSERVGESSESVGAHIQSMYLVEALQYRTKLMMG